MVTIQPWVFITTCWSRLYDFNLVHHPTPEKLFFSYSEKMPPGWIWTWDSNHKFRTYTCSRPLGYGPVFWYANSERQTAKQVSIAALTKKCCPWSSHCLGQARAANLGEYLKWQSLFETNSIFVDIHFEIWRQIIGWFPISDGQTGRQTHTHTSHTMLYNIHMMDIRYTML